jgi:protein-tyrosine-phosphatase
MKKIVFVCAGNTCRSPMAEGYFNSLADNRNLGDHLKGFSAGTNAAYGMKASEIAIELCQKDGINISSHVSQPLTPELAAESYLILTMTEKQKQEILKQFQQMQGKLFTLKEFVHEKGDIEDPIGTSLEVYEKTYREIKKAVEIAFERIKNSENSDRK